MSSAPIRKANEKIYEQPAGTTTALYIMADCPECGGEPVLYLIRAKKLSRIHLDRADVLAVQNNDILGAYCTVCEQMIELDWRIV